MKNGNRRFRIWLSHRNGGRKYCGYWGSRGQTCGSPACFTRPWFKPSWYKGRIHASWRPSWSRPFGPSTTGRPVGWWVNSPGNDPMRGGSIHPWRRIFRRRVCRWLIPTLIFVRTQLPNILWLIQYWSCFWWWSITRGHGYQSGGGNGGYWTSRACGRRRGNRRQSRWGGKVNRMITKTKTKGNSNT